MFVFSSKLDSSLLFHHLAIVKMLMLAVYICSITPEHSLIVCLSGSFFHLTAGFYTFK